MVVAIPTSFMKVLNYTTHYIPKTNGDMEFTHETKKNPACKTLLYYVSFEVLSGVEGGKA
jgi:hypothetical protein